MMKTIKRVHLALAISAAGLIAVTEAPALVSSTINYQGRLVDSGVLVNGNRTIGFRFYNVLAGGTPLATSTQTLAVVDGLFSASINTGTVYTNGTVYLELDVGGLILAPRERIQASLFAVAARTVEGPDLFVESSTGHIGLGTQNPETDLHILSRSSRLGSIRVSPNEPFSGDDAEIVLTEDDDNTYHMRWTYDGGDNRLYAYGKNNASVKGPHFGINRDNGRVGIGTGTADPATELEVVGTVMATAFDGDGSNVSAVPLETLTVNDSGVNTNINNFLSGTAPNVSSNRMLIYEQSSDLWKSKSFARVAFHASCSLDQTVSDTAYAWMHANNTSSGENFEESGGYGDIYQYTTTNSGSVLSGGGGYFTAPVDGIYFFESSVLWDNANGVEGRNAIFIRRNNTDEVGAWSVSGGTDFFSVNVSTTLELNKGDDVSIRIYNGDSSSMDTFSQSGKYCYFSGFLVFPQ